MSLYLTASSVLAFIWYLGCKILIFIHFIFIHFIFIHFIFIHFIFIHFMFIHFIFIHFIFIHFIFIHFIFIHFTFIHFIFMHFIFIHLCIFINVQQDPDLPRPTPFPQIGLNMCNLNKQTPDLLRTPFHRECFLSPKLRSKSGFYRIKLENIFIF